MSEQQSTKCSPVGLLLDKETGLWELCVCVLACVYSMNSCVTHHINLWFWRYRQSPKWKFILFWLGWSQLRLLLLLNLISWLLFSHTPLCCGLNFYSLCFRSSAEIVRRRVVAWDTSGKGKFESHLSQEGEKDRRANSEEQRQAAGGVPANASSVFPRQRVRYIYQNNITLKLYIVNPFSWCWESYVVLVLCSN